MFRSDDEFRQLLAGIRAKQGPGFVRLEEALRRRCPADCDDVFIGLAVVQLLEFIEDAEAAVLEEANLGLPSLQ